MAVQSGPAGQDGKDTSSQSRFLPGVFGSYDFTQTFSLNAGWAKDTSNGADMGFGLLGVKIGRSAAQRRMDELEAKIAALEAREQAALEAPEAEAPPVPEVKKVKIHGKN